jgi:hypothetical protein
MSTCCTHEVYDRMMNFSFSGLITTSTTTSPDHPPHEMSVEVNKKLINIQFHNVCNPYEFGMHTPTCTSLSSCHLHTQNSKPHFQIDVWLSCASENKEGFKTKTFNKPFLHLQEGWGFF